MLPLLPLLPPPPRAACLAALLLLVVCAAPVDPQWRALRAASGALAPSYSRDISVPVGELRYPGSVGAGYASYGGYAGYAGRKPAPSEQPPRSRRQYKGSARPSASGYSKQSTFALLRQLISETTNETRTAFNQIGDILGSQFADSTPRPRPRPPSTSTTTTAAPSAEANATSSGDAASSTSTTTTTTTEAPYRISRQELFGILQRNSIGLGRLFRREYNTAMQDSKVNLNRFKQEFRMVVAPFLQPATTEAPSSTTSSRR